MKWLLPKAKKLETLEIRLEARKELLKVKKSFILTFIYTIYLRSMWKHSKRSPTHAQYIRHVS